MKNILIIILSSTLLLGACKKSKTEDQLPQPAPQPEVPSLVNPPMETRDLAVSIGVTQSISFDLDNDGKKDIAFRTQNVSYEGNTKTKVEFLAEVSISTKLAVDTATETTPRLLEKQAITLTNLQGYQWYNIASIMVMQKVWHNSTTGWEGKFKESGRAFLPFQLVSNGETKLGWVELSTNLQTERLHIHRIAFSKQPADKIFTGIL